MKSMSGVVVRGPCYEAGICRFSIFCGNNVYEVLSYGQQAVKDNIFIEQGQTICVQGKDGYGIFYNYKSSIKLDKDQLQKER